MPPKHALLRAPASLARRLWSVQPARIPMSYSTIRPFKGMAPCSTSSSRPSSVSACISGKRWLSSMNSSLREDIQREIDGQPVVIFCQSGCPASASAKKKFKKLGVEPTIIELDRGGPQAAAEAAIVLAEMTGETALPLVFVAGQYTAGNAFLASDMKSMKAAIDKHVWAAKIRDEIMASPITIFAKAYCTDCKEVKQLFVELGVEPATFEVDSEKLRGNLQLADTVQAVLAEMTSTDMAPWVFIGGSFVGSRPEVVALARSGMLRTLVDDAVAPDTTAQDMRQMVLHEIQSSPVVLFTKSSCARCVEVTALFDKLDANATLYDFDAGDLHIADELQSTLSDLTGSLSAPYVFVSGAFVGNDDVFRLASGGELRDRVDAALSTPSAELKRQVLREIKSNNVVAFIKSQCPISVKMQQAFWDMGEEVVYFDLDAGDADTARNLGHLLHQLTGRSDFPQVFVDGRFEVSGDDVPERLATGRLRRRDCLADALISKNLSPRASHEQPIGSTLLQFRDVKRYCGDRVMCDF